MYPALMVNRSLSILSHILLHRWLLPICCCSDIIDGGVRSIGRWDNDESEDDGGSGRSACLHRLGSLSSCRNSAIPPCLPDLALRMCRSRCQSCCTCTGFAVLATHTYITLISIDQATAALNLRTELNGEEAGRERKAGRRRRCKASLVFFGLSHRCVTSHI